jgi:hypothetical protein
MRLPKGASYRFTRSDEGRALLSTKNTSIDEILGELAARGFTGYIRVTVEIDAGLEDGYLLLCLGSLVGAGYVGLETVVGAQGLEAVRSAWECEGIVDLYEFNEIQLQYAVEENGAALLVPVDEVMARLEDVRVKKRELEEQRKEEEAKREAEIEAAKRESEAKIEKEEPSTSEETAEEPVVDRTALLKKLGLNDPDDEFASVVLHSFNLPSDRELSKQSRSLKREILRALKKKKRFKELDLFITPSRLSEYVLFEIDVYVKPLKKGTSELVETTIDSVFESDLGFPFEKKISVSEG